MILKKILSPFCIIILGGSFDPIHNGHIALGKYFISLLQPNELRIIPTGNPWQKFNLLHASSFDRIEMIKQAFNKSTIPIIIDRQEIFRTVATYTIDTLKILRAKFGEKNSMVFLIGADQLQRLHTWLNWQNLFNYVHVCVISRPGFIINCKKVSSIVMKEFIKRMSNIHTIRTTSHGKTYLALNLNINVSSSYIRTLLHSGKRPTSLIPENVLNYIEQHDLYK